MHDWRDSGPGYARMRGRTRLAILACAFALGAQAASAGDYTGKKPVVRNFPNQTPLPRAYTEKSRAGEASARVQAPASPSRAAAAGTGRTAGSARAAESSPHTTYRLKAPLEGGVSVDVPRTPEDVARYLKLMKFVITDYETVAVQTLMPAGVAGPKVDSQRVHAARDQSLEVIRRIRSITPPRELTDAHNALATTMSEIGSFMENPHGAGTGLEALARVGPLTGRLHQTISRYHGGVKNCIAYYQLDPSLDPFSNESQETKEQLSGLLDSMKSSLFNPRQESSQPSAAASNAPAAMGGLDLAGLSQLLSGMGGSAGQPYGQAPAAGGLDFSKFGNLDQLKNLDFSSLMNQGASHLDSLGELNGPPGSQAHTPAPEAGGSPAHGLNIDPATMNDLSKLLKQFQGN